MSHALLNEILQTVGAAPAGDEIEFVGQDPIFPTTFRVGDLGSAVIGATGLEAARLFELRSGRAQQVRVDVDWGAATMRSGRLIQLEPGAVQPPPIEANGTYQTRDGRWMYFQRLFPHHIERQLEVLGCDRDEESIKKAVAQRDGLELEEAIVANGATPGMVRSRAEWMATEHGQAVSKLPLLEVMKIADGDPQPLGPGDRPLSGVRMLDVTRVLAGPTAGRTFAEHGADVLRIGTSKFPDNERMMRDTGHGKRSTELDLKSADGLATLKSLLAEADVFSQGYRPGAIAALGLSPDDLAEIRPGIVAVTISAFGHSGPWSDRRGFESVVQNVSGITDEGTVDGRPRGIGANVLDYGTGYLAAFGAMLALERRAREGGSYHVRVSLAQTGQWIWDMGRTDAEAAAARPDVLTAERMAEIRVERDTPFGRLTFIAPCAQLSETPGRWDLPTAPLNQDRPEWL